jgi:pyruvate/2-oxoglutarate dehydrogenase complex dihydrolipoamide dehydrogenase (E3) component
MRGFGRVAGRDEQGRPRVEVAGRTFSADRLVIATGTAPVLPPIPGLAELTADGLSPDGPVWTNREVLQIRQAPASLLVIGGGTIGCELAQGFARFGVTVTQLELGPRILAQEEPETSAALAAVFEREGIAVHTGVHIDSVAPAEDGVAVTLGDGQRFSAEKLLVAAGRKQHIPDLGLDSVGLDPHAKSLDVDEHMQVADGIFAVGDVTGKGPFTHVAVWQARVLVAHLLGRTEPFGGYAGLAWATFTDPEVGRVGLSEQQARGRGLRVSIGMTEIASNTRGWIYGQGNDGFVKLVADADRQVLVGATVVAPGGGEILGLLTLAVHAEVPLWTLRTMHYAYPTLHRSVSEALATLG